MMKSGNKGKIRGLGAHLRSRTMARRKSVAHWHEMHHEKRSGVKRLLLMTENKEHHVGGRIKFVHGTKRACGLQFHELPIAVGKTVIVIKDVRVEPHYQSEHLTPEMILQVRQIARSLKRVTAIELTVESDNARAKSIYDKFGFVEYERMPHPEKKGVDIISMALPVNA